MLGANVVLIVLLGQLPGESADLSDLVAALGAGQYSVREAASRALEELGGAALPALRAARDSHDPEIRNRAGGLVQKIESALLTRPTRVRLDFDRAPLTDVVRSLSQQAGFKVALYPETLPKWKYARITLHEREPVSFWKAVDLLSDAALIEPNSRMHGITGPREPTFAFTDAPARAPTPNSDHGPFRVSLVALHYQRDVTYVASPTPIVPGFGPPRAVPRPAQPARPAPARPPAGGRLHPVTTDQCTAHLLVAAEPRLCVSQNGALQLVEAVDDRGNSLIAQAGGGTVIRRTAGYFGISSGPVMQLQAQLRHPENPGRTIRKIRGVIPVSVSSRGPQPLIVPLDQARGKPVANDDFEITVHAIRRVPNPPQTLIELTVRSIDRPAAADGDDSDPFVGAYHADTHRQQLEIVDARGRLISSWYPSGVNSETSRLTLTLMNQAANVPLKELRYYTLTRATVDLPFEFNDVPMP